MNKFLAGFVLAVGTILFMAATTLLGTPTWQIDNTGACRGVYAWDVTGNRGVSIGCIDTTTGAWKKPPSQVNSMSFEEADLRSLGYKGDGSSHPLNSVSTFNGRDSSHWTLSQWQAILPAASALTDELDGVVINSILQLTPTNVSIKFGPGVAQFGNKAMVSACQKNVTLIGAGSLATILEFGTADGWDHCTAGYTGGGADSITLKDIRFSTNDTTSTSNYGFKASTLGGHFENFYLNGFNSGMLFTNAGGVTVEKGFVYSNRAIGSTTVGNGIEFQGTYSFVNHIFDTLVQNYQIGYRFFSTPTSGQIGIEDVRLINSAAGASNKCVEITSSNTGYSPLDYSIENMSCDAYSGYVNAQAVNQLTIRGGNWLLHAPVSTWGSSSNDMFRFCRIAGGRLEDAYVSGEGDATSMNSYVHIIASGSTCGAPTNVGPWDFKVINNHFDVGSVTATTAYLIKDNLSIAVVFENNQFTSGFSPTDTPPSNAYSWSQFDTSSALYIAHPGEPRNTTNTIASTSGTTQNVVTLALPRGQWWCSPSLLVAPSGATVTQIIFGMSTTTASLPTPPFQGAHTENGSWTGNQTRGSASFFFDFLAATGNTNVFLVENLSFSGGTVNAQGALQCIRVR